ncbi:nudix hydrolase 2 [Triticum urartu]|uniref:Nudix hydrolase domain-containing protein n=1 Tax=Triticum urartu TaxID=4572 RepID=A0A8R7V6V3_TRIUA|nr:nudix hydrolase 2 [Triticum urartu]
MAAPSLSTPLTTRAPLLRLLRRRRGLALSAAPPRLPVCSAPPRHRRSALFLGLGGAGGRHRSGLVSRTMSASIYSTKVDAESAMTTNGRDMELLPFVNDKHEGVIIEMTTPMDPQVFSASLKSLLSKWREQGKRGVWIKLPISLANLIQSAVEEGFWYHHAEETYLMLAYWLPNTPHTLPVNATHRVGVGAFVMNDKREVLVVQEKSGVLKGSGIWKFPTGVVEPGEDINIGVVREVKEETGVDAEFVEVLAFRQSHKAYFEKSDLFFVCILRPHSFDITKQESEIEDAQWMPVEEFAAQPFVQKHELVKYILEVGLAKTDKEYAGFSPISIKSAFSEKQSLFYMNRRDLEKASGPIINTQKDS